MDGMKPTLANSSKLTVANALTANPQKLAEANGAK